MSQSTAEKFLENSSSKSFDTAHSDRIQRRNDKYTVAFENSKRKFYNLENTKKKANLIQWYAIENLDQHLVTFETNFIANGGQVRWANTIEEAQQEIWKIINDSDTSSIIKSKSTTLSEIELTNFLEKKKITVLESDLDDYISVLSNQRNNNNKSIPQPINLTDVGAVLQKKFDLPQDATADMVALKLRELLQSQYTNASISITGANFLIADTGSVALSENQGNERLITTFPKIHITVVGIEKVLPTLQDLTIFWPLLASHATGQNQTVYNTLLSGPRKEGETDGPEQMYVILLDNGRTDLLKKKEQRQALYCIQCGACLHACPVYKLVELDTSKPQQQTPLDALLLPHKKGMQDFKKTAHLSTLCGKCSEVCPVSIDINKLLLENRREAVAEKQTPSSEEKIWNTYTKVVKKRTWLDFFGGKFKNFILKNFFKKAWGEERALPEFTKKSFATQWKEEQKEKE